MLAVFAEAPGSGLPEDCEPNHELLLEQQKNHLEGSYKQKFKQLRRFMPYIEACLWARQFGFRSKEEWDDWIDQGEGYYPGFTRDPEPYYTRHGTWRGWAHFLGYSDMEIGVTEEHSDAD